MQLRIGLSRLRESVRKTDSFEGILSVQEFRKVLDRECSRSDRSRQNFALLLCEFRNGAAKIRAPQPIALQIARRVRNSDLVGMFDSERIGIILPETDISGARRLAGSFQECLEPNEIAADFTIFIYPSLGTDSPAFPSDNENQHAYPDPADVPPGGQRRSELPVLPLEYLLLPPFNYPSRGKRMLDITVSIAVLILLAPLMFLTGILIFIVSPGPIIFRQERLGYLRKPFTIWKFRTMRPNCDDTLHKDYIKAVMKAGGPLKKLDSQSDPRLIAFGKLFRKCYLDELPQLVNVIRGEMSLVGPRPCLPFEAEDLLPWQRRRFYALPGMTGLWQVNGKENSTHLQMLRYDVAYVRNSSVSLNLRIILRTLPAVLQCRCFKELLHSMWSKERSRLKLSPPHFDRNA